MSLQSGAHSPGRSRHNQKRFVVAVDGSRLGFRAVKLAAWLLDDTTHDSVQCVCCTRGITTAEAVELIKQGEQVLKDAGVSQRNVRPGAALDIPAGMSLAETLCKAASGGHLVMGAGGKRLQEENEKRGAKSAMASMGSVTTEAMDKCRAPVIVAKPKCIPELDQKEFYLKRKDVSIHLGMVIMVAVDASSISQKAFDMVLRMVKPGDSVHVVNVTNSGKRAEHDTAAFMEEKDLHAYYLGECSKASSRFDHVEFTFKAIPIKQSSIVETIVAYEDAVAADFVVMGSVELAKTNHGIGSVCAGVAKKTVAHMLISKNFA